MSLVAPFSLQMVPALMSRSPILPIVLLCLLLANPMHGLPIGNGDYKPFTGQEKATELLWVLSALPTIPAFEGRY